MRILILGINFYPEPVGIGKYTGEMANWLAARGHEVRIVAAPPHNPQWRVAPGYRAWNYSLQQVPLQNGFDHMFGPRLPAATKMQVHRCPIWVPRTPNGLRRLLHLLSFGLSSWPAMLWQVPWRPDVVLLVEPTLFCSLQALFVARWCGARAWLHVQDFETDAAFRLGDLSSPRVREWALAVERRLMLRFDRVSTISERMVERLILKGVDPSRCVLFPNWVDTALIYPLTGPSPLRRELDIADHAVVALYSGGMGKKQGLDLLVDAARRLADHTHLRFIFCGDGSYRQTLVERAGDLRNIFILPLQPAERLNDLLNMADIHLLPQRADAADLVMPSKLTGMMASGRPTVATAHSGTQLATAVSGRGLVVPSGDLNAFVSALLRLARDTNLRLKLGQEARKHALANLDARRILLRWEQDMLAACGESHGSQQSERAQGSTAGFELRRPQAAPFEHQHDTATASVDKPCSQTPR